MKIINVIQLRYLIAGGILFGLSGMFGCATPGDKTSVSSNQATNSNSLKKAKDVPNPSPTIEIVVKDNMNKPAKDKDPVSENPSDVKSSDIKNSGNLADKLTKANFDKINEGMSYDEVTKIFSDKGMQTSTMKVNERETVIFKWSNDDFSRYIDVEFEKEKVVSKKQKGL